MENRSADSNTATLVFPKGVETGMIENFMQMLERVVPLLGNIKDSLRDCVQKIPDASNGLDGVNQATEVAAVEILNALENLGKRFDTAKSILTRLRASNDYQQDLLSQISTRLKEAGNNGSVSSEISTLASLLDKYLQASSSAGSYATIEKYLDESQRDFLNISIALQVQDITAQQIEAAKVLIAAVHEELIVILKHFEMKRKANGAAPTQRQMESDKFNGGVRAEQQIADKIVVEWKNMQSPK